MKNLKNIRQGKFFEIETNDKNEIEAEKKIKEMSAEDPEHKIKEKVNLSTNNNQ